MGMHAYLTTNPKDSDLRRIDRRQLNLEAVANIGQSEGVLIEIVDLSSKGMMIKGDPTRLGVGDEIAIELPRHGHVSALVRWHEGEAFGLEFDTHVPQGAIAAALLKSTPAPSPPLEARDEGVSNDEASARQDTPEERARHSRNFYIVIGLSFALWALIGFALAQIF